MEKIQSIEQYKELIRWNKARFDQIRTNCILMNSEIQKMIEDDRLSFQAYENGVIIRCSERRYDLLYYFWCRNKPFPTFIDPEKPLIIEEMIGSHSAEADMDAFEPILTGAGFCLLKTSEQWICADRQHIESLVSDMEDFYPANLTLQAADSISAGVTELWEKYLDLADIPMEHYTLHEHEFVHNFADADNSIAATHWWNVRGKNSESRHLVTNPDYQRRGLAGRLLCVWLLDTLKYPVSRWSTWIRNNNAASQSLYRELGFTSNGKICRQYIFK